MTLPYDVLAKAFANAKKLVEEKPEGLSVLRGVQMEGPYFSYAKRGAQNPAYLKDPDFEGFRKLYEDCGGLLKIVDIAPELPGAQEFIRQAKDLATVSTAHTDSDYDHAKAACDAGVTHLTHLYNAMPSISHRAPGVIPAAAENENVQAELICDGLHVHPAAVRLAFRMFKNRIVLVSDSGRCCGLPDGTEFDIGGQTATLIQGVARLGNGTIACSATNLYDCMVNAMRFQIPEAEAVRAASYNPAKALGVQNEVGSIAEGMVADFLVCRDNYRSKTVYLAGKAL
jgi:N-acetylglucosamine-6-phosphate deacetylase